MKCISLCMEKDTLPKVITVYFVHFLRETSKNDCKIAVFPQVLFFFMPFCDKYIILWHDNRLRYLDMEG